LGPKIGAGIFVNSSYGKGSCFHFKIKYNTLLDSMRSMKNMARLLKEDIVSIDKRNVITNEVRLFPSKINVLKQ